MNTPLRAMVLALAVLLGGCASHHQLTADAEQRSADDLQRAGAGGTTAARNAQERADEHRRNAQCKELLPCALDLVGQVVLGLLEGRLQVNR